METERQKEFRLTLQLEKMIIDVEYYLQSFLDNNYKYEDLLTREKAGEDVEVMIKINRLNAEIIREGYMKVLFKGREWVKMNPDWFKDPIGKALTLKTFRMSDNKHKQQTIKVKNLCPECKIKMDYLKNLDAYQCPKCRKRFYYWENKFIIFGRI